MEDGLYGGGDVSGAERDGEYERRDEDGEKAADFSDG